MFGAKLFLLVKRVGKPFIPFISVFLFLICDNTMHLPRGKLTQSKLSQHIRIMVAKLSIRTCLISVIMCIKGFPSCVNRRTN